MNSPFFVCVLCVGFLSITSFRLPPVEEYVYRESTSVELLTLEHPASYRQRRSDDCSPDHIGVRFTADNNEVKLSLQRNYDINVNAPLYVNINETIMQESLENSENVAVYQDLESGSAILVQCIPSTRKFELFGTFYNGSEELMIEPELNEGQDILPAASLSDVQSRKAKSKKEQVSQDQDVNEKFTISHHVIYKGKTMRPKETDYIVKGDLHSKHRAGVGHSARNKRATTAYQVELLMVADYSAYSFWLTKSSTSTAAKVLLRQFYAFVLNGMDLRYKSVTGLGFTITVLFGGLYIAETPASALWTESRKVASASVYQVDASAALANFSTWIQSTPNLPAHDHAMLFTAYDLTANGNNGVAGLAYVEATCTSYSQSIVEDNFDAQLMTIAAHELGHSLGAYHDGTTDGTGDICLPSWAFIMSASVTLSNLGTSGFQYNKNLWKFSSCSLSYFQKYINTLASSNCLTTLSVGYNSTALSPYDQQNPGQIYSADTQCRYTQGNDSYLCRSIYRGNYTNVCTAFYCQISGSLYCSLSIAAERTTCGDKKWCVAGECVTATEAPSVNDTCPFGDQPGIVADGQTCTQLVANSSTNCYYYGGSCCGSCQSVYTGIIGCEYGDKATGCLASNCAFYSNTSLALCCKTCYVPPATTTTTTQKTITIAATTSATITATPTPTTSTAVPTPSSTTSAPTPSSTAAPSLSSTTATPTQSSTTAASTTMSTPQTATPTTTTVVPRPSSTTVTPAPSLTTAAQTSTATAAPIATSTTSTTTPSSTTATPTPSTITTAPTPSSTTVAPTPSSTIAAPSLSSTTAAPTPSSTTAAPTPSSTTAAPTPNLTTLAPTPNSATSAPTPSSTTAAPTPISTTAAPTLSSATANLTSRSTTAAPTPSSTTAAPTPSSTTAYPTPSSTTAAPTPSSTTAAPTPSSTTASPTSSSTTAAPTPSSTTVAPTLSSATANLTSRSTTAAPTPSSTTAAPTPISTTAALTLSSATANLTSRSTTAAPTPSSTTAAPTPSSTTAYPTPNSSTASPTPSSTTAAPTPSSTTASPTQSSTTASPTSSSTTAAPTPTSSIAAPSPSSTTAAPTSSSTRAAPTPSSTTAASTPILTTSAPTPTSSTAAPKTSSTTAAPIPSSTTAAPTQSSTTASPTPSSTTAAPTPSLTTATSNPSSTIAATTETLKTPTATATATIAPSQSSTTATPTPISSTATPTPSTTTSSPTLSSTTTASTPTSATPAPTPTSSTAAPTPSSTIPATTQTSKTATSTATATIASTPTSSTATQTSSTTTTSPSPSSTTAAPTLSSTTSPTPSSTTAAPTLSSTTASPTPSSTTSAPTPSSTTATIQTSKTSTSTTTATIASTPTSSTATQTPSTTTASPTPSSTTAAPTPTSSTAIPTPSTTTALPSPTSTTSVTISSSTTSPTTSTTTTTAAPITTSEPVFPSTSISITPSTTNTTTTTEQQGTKTTEVTVRLNYNISSADNLSDSSTYSRYVDIVGDSLREYYTRKVGQDVQINIRDIRRGSLIVDFELVYINTPITYAALAKAHIDLAAGENITVGGQVSGVESMVVENTTVPNGNSSKEYLCTVYILVSGGCRVNFKCVVLNSSPLCQPINTTTDIVPIAVAAAVAGFVIIVAVVALICSLQRRFKNRDKHMTEASDDSRSESEMKLPEPSYFIEGHPKHDSLYGQYPNVFAYGHKWYPGYGHSNNSFNGRSGELNSYHYYMDLES
ncbi:hypothetical protein ACJMK2_013425 [Sinanodonta woodiana]|uniref:Peptidase M12B domain-containing protein n=1 Tax=Sinanodonta woodiana TaxID=1069815 RepID=A0ABD3UXG5_SINWO